MAGCIIFDVDDTLIEYVDFDFEEWFNFIAKPVAKRFNIPMDIEIWRLMIRGEISRRYPEKYGVCAETFWREVDENNLQYRKFMLKSGRLRKYEDCDAIKQINGLKIAWSASSEDCVRFVLKTFDLLHYFDGVFGKDYQNYRFLDEMKPRPGLLMEIKKLYGCTKCYVVGDDKRDMIAAKAAGCTAIFLNRKDERKLGDFTIKSLWELKNVLSG